MSEVLIRLRKIDALNSVNLSFGQESKSSFSNESFLFSAVAAWRGPRKVGGGGLASLEFFRTEVLKLTVSVF